MKSILIEISPGELIDRITILELKIQKQTDPVKRQGVAEELAALMQVQDRLVPGSAELTVFRTELAAVNQALWKVEDELRVCEKRGEFGCRFIELARSRRVKELIRRQTLRSTGHCFGIDRRFRAR